MTRSDARKRLEGDHQVHWDPAVREIVARERAAAKAEALREAAEAREFRSCPCDYGNPTPGPRCSFGPHRPSHEQAQWLRDRAAAIEGADQ